MATPAQINGFRIEFDQIDAALRRDVRRIVPAARRLPPDAIRDMLLELGPQFTDRYGQAASLAAAEFFESTTGYAARTAELTQHDAVRGSVRTFAGDFWTPGREMAFEKIAASLARHSLQAGRSTIAESATRNRITYARAPEPGACKWCNMLASRGATYGSRKSAGAKDEGNEYHDNCRCTPEPISGDQQLSYDVDAAYAQYMKDYYGS